MKTSKYSKLKNVLIRELEGFKTGDFFYSEKEVMKKYSLSYATVSRAMKELANEGYFSRKRGVGTIINDYKSVQGTGYVLYFCGIDYRNQKTVSPLSWFVYDEIQKGVINSYPGPLKIEGAAGIMEKIKAGENFDLICFNPDKELLNEVHSSSLKYIIINHYRDPEITDNSVSWEMLSGVYSLMSYLIKDLGHEKIGFIGGNSARYHADRYAGYEIGLRTYNIPFREEYTVRGLLGTEEDGYNAMQKLLSLPEPPTAVFADTDIKANGAMKAAVDSGLRVPEDISVAGFDNMPGAEFLDCPLTTVGVPYSEISRAAVEMLLERIETNSNVEERILHAALIKRKSCSVNNKKEMRT